MPLFADKNIAASSCGNRMKLPAIRAAHAPPPSSGETESSADELMRLKHLLQSQQDRLNERCQLFMSKSWNSKNSNNGDTFEQPVNMSMRENLPQRAVKEVASLNFSGTRGIPRHASFTPPTDVPHLAVGMQEDKQLHAEESDQDSEVQQLEEDLNRRHSRINRMQHEMARAWRAPHRNALAAVQPPLPPVLLANSDREVAEMAALVYDFANAPRKKNSTDSRDVPKLPQLVDTSNMDELLTSANGSTPSMLGDADHSMGSMTMDRLSMRSSSILRVTDGAVALMELLANQRDVILPSPSEIGVARSGDVLSAYHVLKVDLQDALRSRKGPTGIIAGAPFFRMVPKLNIGGVAQPNISSICTIVNELRRASDGHVEWVNLREEPLIYVNNEAHIVRERKDPFHPMLIPNVTGRSIAQIEEKLKQEVLKEARENGGNISVHMEGKEGVMEDQWECADTGQVFTLHEVFNMLRPNVTYYRRPITRNVGPQPQDFDFIYDLCMEDPRAVIVFNCQTGRGKTSAMMMIASIVRFYQLCAQDAAVDIRLLRSDTGCFHFRTIKKIVSLIPDGKIHERRLMVLLELSDKVYSIAEHISAAFNAGTATAEEAIMHLQQYAYFIVFSYYCEQRLWSYNTKAPFSVWLSENNELKFLIASILSMEEEYKEERIAAPLAHGEEAWAANIVRKRRGNVLSSGRILCSVPMETDTVGGVNALRQLAPDVPIFTCGRLSEAGRQFLVSEIRQCFPNQKRIQWISLRAEPMVFINDVSFTLSDYDAVACSPGEMGSTMHVSLQAMEQIEERLRRDVLLEAQEHKGEILLHRVNEENMRTAIRVKVCSVRTPKSTMADFASECDVRYHRIPIPFSGHMVALDMDPLLEYLSKFSVDHDVFIINDTEGSTRTTVALNLLTVYRASRVRNLRLLTGPEDFTEVLRVGHSGVVLPHAQIVSSVQVNSNELPKTPVELLVASTICQMLTAGSLLRVVEGAMDLGGRGTRWNILHALNRLKEEIMKTSANKVKVMREAVSMVRTYLLVLLCTIYIDSVGDVSTSEPFSDWVEKRVEVANIIANLDQRAEHTIKYVESHNLLKADVSRRNGDVLTANFALKADHFPGCQKKGLVPEVCGAPNFRKVDNVNVYGVAIPTLMGIHNILSVLGAAQEPLRAYPGEQNDKNMYIAFAAPRLFDPRFRPEELSKPLRGHVVWVNLREEPILYVGDRPFVFRNLEAPYVNVELSGIAANKVEHVETQLRADVLKEAEQHNGMFLVNDEGNPGELVGLWEKATTETVKTVREVYNELLTQDYRVSLLRLPVTDEQSPDVEDFDALVAALLPRITAHMDRRETLSFVFNCQMGRGRTTTGMVVCCLLIGLVIPEYYNELDIIFDPLYHPDESPLSRGEYGCIVQLKRVLTGGRSAKHHVDLVIEACSKMQNLRTAIESFALQVKSPDVTESQRGRAHHHGVHYLRRYFNLITFAAYLHEEYTAMKKQMRCTYASWLAQRPELTTLCESAALK
ncbi:metal ion binding protein [Trypanosoma grayi]|uniref:metal ion binding protein n=1 Tax=Trypanosoma grayi TaxID=71804 RepID=UPI0004F4902B|nr:metal ion binding protein [Trypanosoma grayi]KEG08823.1 metal ion binding protein [Trypanosoma grayi]